MTEVIMAHDGMVNEFVGDAILAVFGAPEIHDDDALRAVRCGIAMQLALEELNREHRVEGVRDFEMGIGIHTGEVLLGNIGNERRAKYGVVGDTVNMTARIEGLTCGGQVLISHEGYASAGMSVEVKSAREVMFKGGADIMRIYSVVGVDGPEGKIALKEMESAQELRPSSIAAKAYPITGKGKSVSEHAVEVVITGVGQRLLAIECGSIEELDDVKIELDGRPLAAPIYGKIIDRDIASGLLRAAVPLDLEQIFAQDHGR
jgi:hypothetical protein